jgi:hypothetical protein
VAAIGTAMGFAIEKLVPLGVPAIESTVATLCAIYGLAIGIVEFVRESPPKEAPARGKEPVN